MTGISPPGGDAHAPPLPAATPAAAPARPRAERPLRARLGAPVRAVALAWAWARVRVPRRHRHYYQPIAVSYHRPMMAARGATTVVLRCFCSRPDQYAWQTIPGEYELADLVSAENPGLISASALRKIVEGATQ